MEYLLPRYRLPTEAEWEFAAYALKGNTFEERIFERRIYPWDGHNVRNANPKNQGEFMANFVRGRGDMMGVAGSLNDNGSITVDVKSYWPNDYGLYCMAGNVNEWVQDVYSPFSAEDIDGFNPFRGNVYTDLSRDANGNLLTKDNLGRMRLIPFRMLMWQTGITTRKVITGTTGMVTICQLYLKQLKTGNNDPGQGSRRMYVQDDKRLLFAY